MTEDERSPSAYEAEDLAGWDPEEKLGTAGSYPFTRGPYPSMYVERPWTTRQYAGFGDAHATNRRFRALLDAGQTGLSVAFDLPTQMGYDSDDEMASGEVGKVGVAVDSIADMRALFAGIPLGEVTTSMTINSTAAILLLLYELVATEQGVPADDIGGTVQNDILKEYIARGTYIYPPGPSMRLVTDLFAYCAAELPNWNTISISGYHIREAGSTAAQEIAFTVADGLAYVEAARGAGLDIDRFAPRLSFFWNAHNGIFEEAAKYRAARRLWARLMRHRLGASEPESWRMRFHTQTAGSSLTAQQPLNNVTRTAYQALSAVLGGTQSLHTNSYDEALGLPTEQAAVVALRTQQILASETGLTQVVDPLAGSYYVEALTDRLEAEAEELIERIDAYGGAVAAIEAGFQQGEIEEAAYSHARSVESGAVVVVGVNEFVEDRVGEPAVLKIDPATEADQIQGLRRHRDQRDGSAVSAALDSVRVSAGTEDNVLYPMREALRLGATLGEVSSTLESVFGRYRP
ncbi:MAG: methylmalonyl-CoA mutase family protein [Acidimicrobiia bacterium]|nr:MAG: methylmalonyl-CoA mutase family protein [Acidimicrobiia bacterium]